MKADFAADAQTSRLWKAARQRDSNGPPGPAAFNDDPSAFFLSGDLNVQHSFLRSPLPCSPSRWLPPPRPPRRRQVGGRHRDRRTPGARRRARRRQGRTEGRRLRSRQEPEVRVPERPGQHRHRGADRPQVRRRPARRDRRHRHAVGAGGRGRDARTSRSSTAPSPTRSPPSWSRAGMPRAPTSPASPTCRRWTSTSS